MFVIKKVTSTPEGLITIETTNGYKKHFMGWTLKQALIIAQNEAKKRYV